MIERWLCHWYWPKRGKYGGEIISIGTPAETLASNTITAQYLNGKMKLEIPAKKRRVKGKFMKLTRNRKQS
jgi:excinuclease ABC subunit A